MFGHTDTDALHILLEELSMKKYCGPALKVCT